MKYDLNAIIDILSKVESKDTSEPFVFTNGLVTYGGPHLKIHEQEEFTKMCHNTLFISDYGLADVRDLGDNWGFAINHIKPIGNKFLKKASILKAIESGQSIGKSSEKDIAEALNLNPHIINTYLRHLISKCFIIGPEFQQAGKPVYGNCVLKGDGETALEDPSFLVEELNMTNNINNFNAPVASVGNQGTQTNVAGVVEGDQIGTQNNKNIDEINSLIGSLREIIERFPEEQREDAEVEINALEAEIIEQKKQDPKEFFGRRLKKLVGAGTAAAVTIASGGAAFTGDLNTFTDNVLELGEKLGVPIELIQTEQQNKGV